MLVEKGGGVRALARLLDLQLLPLDNFPTGRLAELEVGDHADRFWSDDGNCERSAILSHFCVSRISIMRA